MLLRIFVYSMTCKKEYGKLRSIWFTAMFFGYDTKFLIDFFQSYAIFIKVFVENVTVIFTEVFDI